MGGLSPLWTVHAVLAGPEALRPGDPPGRPGLVLPHGFGTSRWLSGGASEAVGWPLRVENLLNEPEHRHIVLNLARTDLPDAAWIDELHPRFNDGFPRAGRIAEEVRGRLSDMGLRSRLGSLVAFPSSVLPAAALRKMARVAGHLGFEPLVAGLDSLVLPATPPRDTHAGEAVAHRVADLLRASENDQPKASRMERAKIGSSGSRAPIE